MGRIGITEVLLIVVVILLLFGPSKLPEIGAALGKAIREFRQALKGEKSDDAAAKKSE
jgi:sec-independent protein translocase protein TatA